MDDRGCPDPVGGAAALADVIIVGVLLVFNTGAGFWQEHTAADAVAALKRQLAPCAAVRRDGAWTQIDAAGLVPGDVARIQPGDVVPADVVLLDGEYLRVDQSALTRESRPADKGLTTPARPRAGPTTRRPGRTPAEKATDVVGARYGAAAEIKSPANLAPRSQMPGGGDEPDM